jgi:5-methyltetrahydropteroyltriglutamate--homocysteine methyltransferase
MSQQAQIDHYGGSRELAAMDYAAAVNEEIRDLFAAGADVVQIDEPYLQARPERARAYGVEAINRALEGIEGLTALHMCFGYAAIVHSRGNRYAFLGELQESVVQQVSIEAAQPNLDLSVLEELPNKTIILGVLNLGDMQIETPGLVAERIRAALRHLPPERLIVAPDCGMKYLPREVAIGKLRAMVEGARLVRRELGVE